MLARLDGLEGDLQQRRGRASREGGLGELESLKLRSTDGREPQRETVASSAGYVVGSGSQLSGLDDPRAYEAG